jgi:hypothetical protein
MKRKREDSCIRISWAVDFVLFVDLQASSLDGFPYKTDGCDASNRRIQVARNLLSFYDYLFLLSNLVMNRPVVCFLCSLSKLNAAIHEGKNKRIRRWGGT